MKSNNHGRKASASNRNAVKGRVEHVKSTQWQVTTRPNPQHRLLPTQSTASTDCCCFPAGTRVTMADGSHKAIERVAIGDWVMGLTGPVQVYATEAPVLGGRTYLRMEDGSLHWSAEHLFWVQRDGAEYFGSHDKEEHLYEVSLGVLVGLTKREVWSLERGIETYAHAEGWKSQRVVVVPAATDLRLYYVKTTGSHTVMVNGYVVSGGVNDTDFDYNPVQWQGLGALLKAQRAA